MSSTEKSSAPHAHPFAEDQDHRDHDHHDEHDLRDHATQDQDQGPHACYEGWVLIGQIALDPETGEETEEYALYLCRECAEQS